MDSTEIYFVDYGASKVYYTLRENNTIVTQGRTITLSRDKFIDYLAIAQILGYKIGKI